MKTTRKDRQLAKSAKGRRDIALRQEVAQASIRAINNLPLLARLSFMWATLFKRL